LSPWHSTFLGYGWRRWPPDMEGKQSQIADKGGPPAWVLGMGLTTPHRKKLACYEMSQRASDLERFFG
jgi:hypothetical protein